MQFFVMCDGAAKFELIYRRSLEDLYITRRDLGSLNYRYRIVTAKFPGCKSVGSHGDLGQQLQTCKRQQKDGGFFVD